jgi:hypothetical protein
MAWTRRCCAVRHAGRDAGGASVVRARNREIIPGVTRTGPRSTTRIETRWPKPRLQYDLDGGRPAWPARIGRASGDRLRVACWPSGPTPSRMLAWRPAGKGQAGPSVAKVEACTGNRDSDDRDRLPTRSCRIRACNLMQLVTQGALCS